eukprot:PITA_08360
MKPDNVVWGSLLNACRILTNVELAEHATQHLFVYDPKNVAHYVLLSNLYATAGRWDGIEEVRKWMRERKMKDAEHTPDTDFVFQDLEEEEKEHTLCYHNEKLAISFGFISLSSVTSIIVVKNLHIRGDCHSDTKLISKIVARDIVVREAKGLHHFKDG